MGLGCGGGSNCGDTCAPIILLGPFSVTAGGLAAGPCLHESIIIPHNEHGRVANDTFNARSCTKQQRFHNEIRTASSAASVFLASI